MNSRIQHFPAVRDRDLMVCAGQGVAYQADMSVDCVSYGDDYLRKCAAYEGTTIARLVNAGRVSLLRRHARSGVRVLDVGAGTGEFVRAARAAGFQAFGYDVIPAAADALRVFGLYSREVVAVGALTMWDSMEHMEDPGEWVDRTPVGAALLLSLPIFDDLSEVRQSKHYRPGEHLYYWTARGLVQWLRSYGFMLLERSSHETAAGRESIGAFAFCRVSRKEL